MYPVELEIKYTTGSNASYQDLGIIFRNGRRVHRFILCQNYLMFPLVLYPLPLTGGSELLYLRSRKGGCSPISDNLYCSYSCRSGGTVNFTFPFTTDATISIFISQISCSAVGLAPHMDVLKYSEGQATFQ